MKEKRYLPLYYKFIKQKYLDGNSGLCLAFDYNGLAYKEICTEFLTEDEYAMYYGSYFESDIQSVGKFTPLRQNIVLLMAAMNGEL